MTIKWAGEEVCAGCWVHDKGERAGCRVQEKGGRELGRLNASLPVSETEEEGAKNASIGGTI